ncbi:hypothetical protein [Aeromicrobium sp. Leaf350]|uniref:hypothetical protein n=1 Tax=Aeromicrobium sp. Leaf350 TaxID=2876565 RepID=UPI001E629267|nr:hypothetical protein [Aeromicrobium sp. Leaf350]
MRRLFLAMTLIAVPVLFVATPAQAATRTVCATGCDFTTIQAAVTAADPGDVISVGAGTYQAFGVIIDKPLTIQGASTGTTIIDGGGASVGTVPGIFRILPGVVANGTGQVVIRDLTLRNPGKNTTGSQYFGISIGVKQVTTGITDVILDNLDLQANQDVTRPGYGVYADGGLTGTTERVAPNLTITDSTFTGHYYNAIGVDAWRGDVTIARNDLREGGFGNSAILVFNEYSPSRITDPVVIEDNTSVGRLVYVRNIDNNATLDSRGGFDDVTIRRNTVTGLAGTDSGILVSTNSTVATDPTRFGSVQIADNVISGDGTSTDTRGVTIGGYVIDADVTGNSVTGVGRGVSVDTVKAQNPQSVTLTGNRLIGDAVGVQNGTTVAVGAALNWWGCVADPAGPVVAGCSPAVNTGTGSIVTGPWLLPVLSGLPTAPVTVGSSFPVTGRLATSDGSAYTPTGVLATLPFGAAATGGTVAPTTGTLAAGSAVLTYTAPAAPGPATLTFSIDRVGAAGAVDPRVYGTGATTGQPVAASFTAIPAVVTPPSGGGGGTTPGTSLPSVGSSSPGNGALPDTGASSFAGDLTRGLALAALGLLMVAVGMRRKLAPARHRA